MDEEIRQVVEQAVQAARQASQSAEQAAQAAQQAVRQLGAESTRQVVDATRTAGSQEVGAEREFEIGKDEVHAETMADLANSWIANRKRTYDEYQDVGLAAARLAQRVADRTAAQSLDHAARLQVIAERSLNNAATHDADLNAMKIRHNDIAIDRQWNVDEVARLVTNSATFQDAVAALMIAGMGEE